MGMVSKSNNLIGNIRCLFVRMNSHCCPLVIRPHDVKGTYVVHSDMNDYNAAMKSCWLTKSLIVGSVDENMERTFNLFESNIIEKAIDIVARSLNHYLSTYKPKDTNFTVNLINGPFQNAIRMAKIITGAKSKSNGSIPIKSHMDFMPELTANWFRDYKFVRMTCQPYMVIRTIEQNSLYSLNSVNNDQNNVPIYDIRDVKGFWRMFNKETLMDDPGYVDTHSTEPTPHVVAPEDSKNRVLPLHPKLSVCYRSFLNEEGTFLTGKNQFTNDTQDTAQNITLDDGFPLALKTAFVSLLSRLSAHRLSKNENNANIRDFLSPATGHFSGIHLFPQHSMTTSCLSFSKNSMTLIDLQLDTLRYIDDRLIWNQVWTSKPITYDPIINGDILARTMLYAALKAFM